MLTHLRIRNFKLFENADIELDRPVVLIGPNNSGKTTALQALALWDFGLRQWNARRGGKETPEKRPGVTINRLDLTQIPVPNANLLWRGVDVRRGVKVDGTQKTKNVRIEIEVDGVTDDTSWTCGLEFDFSNQESIVCRPGREPGYEDSPVQKSKFRDVPPKASSVKIAYLPPMSGLVATEPKWEMGRINVLLGEGQTAQVIRNLCYQVRGDQEEPRPEWTELVERMRQLFGPTLLPPNYIEKRGEISMEYKDPDGTILDLSSAGRGFLQTLILMAHLYLNRGTVLLLDEPDAHLELLRQGEIFRTLTELADAQGSQIVAASHSEVVLREGAERGTVVAFVGKPHRINDKGTQVLKALTTIGWDQYYQAEQTGWVLYLESASDLAVLQAFAQALNHKAAAVLARPFVSYVCTNIPQIARDHFFGLQEGKRDLVGLAIFDRLDKNLRREGALIELMWARREIENYFCSERVFLSYATHDLPDDLFCQGMREHREATMRSVVSDITVALRTLNKPSPWSPDVKASDDVLDPVFREYFARLKLPLVMRKANYHQLARFLPVNEIDPEVVDKLDAIVRVAESAKPRTA